MHKDRLLHGGFILCDESLNIDDKRCIKLPFKQLAKDLRNDRVVGSIIVGTCLKLFGILIELSEKIISELFGPKDSIYKYQCEKLWEELFLNNFYHNSN